MLDICCRYQLRNQYECLTLNYDYDDDDDDDDDDDNDDDDNEIKLLSDT